MEGEESNKEENKVAKERKRLLSCIPKTVLEHLLRLVDLTRANHEALRNLLLEDVELKGVELVDALRDSGGGNLQEVEQELLNFCDVQSEKNEIHGELAK